MPLRLLALETSGRSGSVAALEEDRLLAEVELDARQRSAQSLAPAMQAALAEVGWSPRIVELVAVTSGPGSFTGLRVGVTTAKTFAYAVDCQLLGVDTLAAIARRAGAAAFPLAVAMPAERNEVFAATFASPPPTGEAPSQLMAIDDWLASLVPGVHVTGPALVKLASRIPPGVTVMDETLWQPRAADVGQLAYALFARGARQSLWELVPRYLRRSAAEEKWDAAKLAHQPSTANGYPHESH